MYYVSIKRRMQCASVSGSIGFPVISLQMDWSGCLHQKMLHIPPCQQKAAENKLIRATYDLNLWLLCLAFDSFQFSLFCSTRFE